MLHIAEDYALLIHLYTEQMDKNPDSEEAVRLEERVANIRPQLYKFAGIQHLGEGGDGEAVGGAEAARIVRERMEEVAASGILERIWASLKSGNTGPVTIEENP